MRESNNHRGDDHFVSVRQLIRDRVQPGAKVCFPQDAKKMEFWNDYPSDESAFRRCVIPVSYDEEGVVFVVSRKWGHEPRELKDSYRGLSRDEVARLCFFWQSDKDFEATHPPETMDAIQEYLADRSSREAEEKRRKAEEDERREPPTPPIGYRWRLEIRLVEKYVLTVE
jgi:hypothetical protein